MGNEQSNPIRNMDKRTARREYRESFTKAIGDFQRENGVRQDGTRGVRGAGSSSTANVAQTSAKELRFDENGKNITVVVRKRPIFQHEIDGHEFDVVTCLQGRTAVVHDTRMHADMRRMLITNNAFAFDGVFDENSSNDMVYQSACKPLVREAVLGGYATVCVYGQTGSGKSFTMTSFYEKAAHDIFSEMDALNERMYEAPRVSMSFFELQGEACLDLLNAFTPAQLMTATDGGVHAFPVVEVVVSSAVEMVALIRHALSIRSTSATGVHDASSRSHAILRIYVEQPAEPLADGERMLRRDQNVPAPPRGEGVLTLVDLAGSEQSIDSMYHTAELRKEGAAINSSLMALKDCVRAKANGVTATHVYRKSKLTMALKDSFVLPTSRTVIVATVSPSSKDTEHSLNTLRHACLMDGQAQSGDETRFMTGGVQSETFQVGEVDVTAISRKNRELKKMGVEVDAKTSNGNYLGADVKKKGPLKKPVPELTEKQKSKARRMADRAGLSRMDPKLRELLLAHRETLGREEPQIYRMRRSQNPYQKADALDQDGADDSPPPAPPGYPVGYPADDLERRIELDKMIYNQAAAAADARGKAQNVGRGGGGVGVTMDEYVKIARQMPFLKQASDEVSQTDDSQGSGSGSGAPGSHEGAGGSGSGSGGSGTQRRPLSARLVAPTKSSHMRVAISSELRSSREIERREQIEAEIRKDDEESDEAVLSYVVQKFAPTATAGSANPENDEDGEAYVEEPGRVEIEQNIHRAPPRRLQQQQQLPPPVLDGRTPYYKLYTQVFGRTVEHHDAEAKSVLHRQLQTLLRMHGYDEDEIAQLIASGRPSLPKPVQSLKKAPTAAAAGRDAHGAGSEADLQAATGTPAPPAAARASHMSSYGGAAAANGARNEIAHSTLQANEMKAANLTRQIPLSLGRAQQRSNSAKAGVATAAQKLQEETRIREERRARALAVKDTLDEEKREAARLKNKSDVEKMKQLQLHDAAKEVESKAALAAQRRENALRVVAQKEAEVKQQALRRLTDKGFGSGSGSPQHQRGAGDEGEGGDRYGYGDRPEASRYAPSAGAGAGEGSVEELEQQQEQVISPRRYSSPPVPGRRRVVDTSADDQEIARVTRLVVQARYQPIEVQTRLKRQLQALKVNKTRKERGEAPLPATPENGGGGVKNSPRPGSSGGGGGRPGSATATARPSSASSTGSSGTGSRAGLRSSQSMPHSGAASSASASASANRLRQSASGSPTAGTGVSGARQQKPNTEGANAHYGGGLGGMRETTGKQYPGQMPRQLRRDVHSAATGSGGGSGNGNDVGTAPSNNGSGRSIQGQGRVSSPNAQAVDPWAPPRRADAPPPQEPRDFGYNRQQQPQPQSVHMQGRPKYADGGGAAARIRVGASAAPFGNSLNDDVGPE